MIEETLLEKAKRIGVDAYTVEDFVNGMEQRDKLLEAAKNLRDVKGRYHTEQAMNRLAEVIAEVEAGK